MKVYIVTIGDEILIGQIVDTNSAWMAGELNLAGAQVVGIQSIGDDLQQIQEALQLSLAKADAVLLTGGLGPTKDDITKKAIADFFGQQLTFHSPTYEKILKLFERWGRAPTPAHRQQCFMPANAELLENKMGTAPGMWFERDGRVVVSMPGVPFEMKYLMEHEVIPKLRNKFPGQPLAHRTILTAGEGESRIAARIADFEETLPGNLKLAYLPGLNQVRLRLSGTGSNQEELDQLIDSKANELTELLPDLVYGYDDQTLSAVVGEMLQERGLTLGTAESCTGGYVAHLLTSIPGSSAYFIGSIIAYANEVKVRHLGVSGLTLEKHGAVSEQTVSEMVAGTLDTLQVDLAVSISGIAGPGGGSPEKPVGTIWLAVGNQAKQQILKLQLGKDRLKNIQYTGNQALNLVRQFLLQEYPA